MVPIVASFPTLAVASLYCLWSVYRRSLRGRERALRERVVYMLWVLATDWEDHAAAPPGEVSAENPFYRPPSGTAPNRVQVSAG
jgi:hypothetical protein